MKTLKNATASLRRMGTLSGKDTVLFSFLAPISSGVNFKEKNLLPLKQILIFKSRPYFERTALSRKANRKSQKLCPFVKMIGNYGGVHGMHLKYTWMGARRTSEEYW